MAALFGPNSQYLKNPHTTGITRQKTIVTATRMCVPEMFNSVVLFRWANTRATSRGPTGKMQARSVTHRACMCVAFGLPRNAAQVLEKRLNRWSLERSQIVFPGRRVRRSNQMSKTRQCKSDVERGAIYGWGSQRTGAACRDFPDALAYSEANSSLPEYCSVNSRNNCCARAPCFSRRAARASTIFANGLR